MSDGYNANGVLSTKAFTLTDTVVLRFDRNSFDLQIGGDVATYDVALAMLAQATRFFERAIRAAQLAEMQNQHLAAEQTAAVLERMRRHKM